YFSSDDDDCQIIYDQEKELIEIDPTLIIKSGLKDINAVNTAINYLRIRGRFLINKFNSSPNILTPNITKINILPNEKNIRQ
ncbi:12022_t:CDS:1, partial [Racocetra fulgida]